VAPGIEISINFGHSNTAETDAGDDMMDGNTTSLRPWLVCLALSAGIFFRVGPVSAADDPFIFRAGRLAAAPVLDGVIDPEEWRGAGQVEGMIQFEPAFGEPSPFPTVIRLGFDDESLYVAFSCTDPEPDRISASVTARDGEIDEIDDSVALLLDTFDDDHTGYYFVTNLLGTQLDGRVADNGRSVDSRWDARWRSAAARTEGGWSAEIAVPFKVLKYRSGDDRVWGVNFMRTVPRRLERSTWAGPLEDPVRVSQAGAVTGLTLPRDDGKRWELIPYALGTADGDGETDFEFGGTARYRISSSILAEATINPDFAIIEADVERINLTRFELSVEEKRPFFLEGNERFSQRIRQFYSRRIGEISWGAKLSGTIGRTDFIVLGAQSDPDAERNGAGSGSEDAAYTVGRIQQGIFGSSNIGLLVANRRLGGRNTGSVGLDSTLFFTDTLGLTAQFVRVHGGKNDGGLAWFVRPSYDSSTTHCHLRYTNLDEGIRDAFNTVGFLRDDNRREFDTNVTRTFWWEDRPVEKVRAYVNYNRYRGQDNVLRSYALDTGVSMQLANRWFVDLGHSDEFERFEEDFHNRITSLGVGYDTRAGRSFKIEIGGGTNFDSDLRLYGAEGQFRITDSWNTSYELTRLVLNPDPDHETTWIHVFSSDYYFTNNLYVKLFFQTNSAITKENVQSVFVWRFKPPFGSLQVAYQRGTSELGQESEQGNSLFTKFSWVF